MAQHVQTSNDPEVQACLENSPVTALSLQALLAQGFYGFPLRELLPRLEADSLLLIDLGDAWVITIPDQADEAAVMTDCLDPFELLLECLTEEEVDSGKTVYAPDETMLPVDSLPLERATAYNLPVGTRSHLYRFDYGSFVEHAENDVIVLSGAFVDLEDGEIYGFTIDAVQQRIRSAETGRIHASRAVGAGTAVSRGTAAAADSSAEATASIP